MGIDAKVLLQVKSRRALRGVIERRRAAGEGALDPLLRPYADGSADFFTGIRFGEEDLDFAIRVWLTDEFGDALSAIHDDPRGVFVFADTSAPRARDYEGVIAEIGDAGVFVPARLVSSAEREAALQKMMEKVDSFAESRPTMAMPAVSGLDPSMYGLAPSVDGEISRAPFDLDTWLSARD